VRPLVEIKTLVFVSIALGIVAFGTGRETIVSYWVLLGISLGFTLLQAVLLEIALWNHGKRGLWVLLGLPHLGHPLGACMGRLGLQSRKSRCLHLISPLFHQHEGILTNALCHSI
jgi:hypothetical protein